MKQCVVYRSDFITFTRRKTCDCHKLVLSRYENFIRIWLLDHTSSLTKIRRHDVLIFRFLFPRASFLPGWGRRGSVEVGAFRNIVDPGELRGGVGRVVRGWQPRVRAGTHLPRPGQRHVRTKFGHRFVMQPAEICLSKYIHITKR